MQTNCKIEKTEETNLVIMKYFALLNVFPLYFVKQM